VEELPEPVRAELPTASSDAGKAVAVVGLSGVIRPKGLGGIWGLLFGSSGGLEAFREAMTEAMNNSSISAIVMDIDSPGGLTDMVPETAAMIREMRGNGKPIVAVANTMAASAAYYLAAQADEVVVTPSGFLGSIGVFTVHYDRSGMNEMIGINPTYISAGKYKVEGNRDNPLGDGAKKALQEEIDEFYDMFVEDVAAGRGVSASEVRNGYGEGRTLTANRAEKAGLADRVATRDEIIIELLGGESSPGGGVTGRAEQQQLEASTDDGDAKFEITDLHLKTANVLSR
jgi:signal peptide peptidase SppA